MDCTYDYQRTYTLFSSFGLQLLIRVSGLMMLLTGSVAQAADFEMLVDIRRGADMYHQQRFANAEAIFYPVYQQMQKKQHKDLERYAMVLDFLAQSRSLQGKSEGVVELMEERLLVAATLFENEPHRVAPMRAGVAEAYFRAGRSEEAKKMAELAIAEFEHWGDDALGHLKLAEANIERYRNGEFDAAELPDDLSDFYSSCDSISAGDSAKVAREKMRPFVELEVDFKPDGFWGMMFEIALQGKDGKARDGDNFRRIYVPGTDQVLLKELCVIDQSNGLVVSADNSVD